MRVPRGLLWRDPICALMSISDSKNPRLKTLAIRTAVPLFAWQMGYDRHSDPYNLRRRGSTKPEQPPSVLEGEGVHF